MKILLALFVSVLTSAASAQLIANSDLDLEHQKMIVKALSIHCVLPINDLAQYSPSISKQMKIDNGMMDVAFQTVVVSHGMTVKVDSLFTAITNVGSGSQYSVISVESEYCKH